MANHQKGKTGTYIPLLPVPVSETNQHGHIQTHQKESRSCMKLMDSPYLNWSTGQKNPIPLSFPGTETAGSLEDLKVHLWSLGGLQPAKPSQEDILTSWIILILIGEYHHLI